MFGFLEYPPPPSPLFSVFFQWFFFMAGMVEHADLMLVFQFPLASCTFSSHQQVFSLTVTGWCFFFVELLDLSSWKAIWLLILSKVDFFLIRLRFQRSNVSTYYPFQNQFVLWERPNCQGTFQHKSYLNSIINTFKLILPPCRVKQKADKEKGTEYGDKNTMSYSCYTVLWVKTKIQSSKHTYCHCDKLASISV